MAGAVAAIGADVLHRYQRRAARRRFVRQLLEQGEQGRPVVAGQAARPADVVAAQRRDRHDAGGHEAGFGGEGDERGARAFEGRARIGDGVELVDREDDVRHAQQLREQGMAARLRQELQRLHRGERRRREVELGRVDEDDGGIAARGRGHHVARVLLVAGRVGDDELALARREVAVGDVDRDALLALGLEAVGEEREVDRLAAAGTRFERIELVGEDRAAVEQEPADQRALAVVDRAGGEEAQRPARAGGCRFAQGERHQK